MADFELEQLKTLFQNLADRLSNTKGDEHTLARLALLDRSLKNIADKIGAHDSRAVIDSKALANKFSREFLDELKRVAPHDPINLPPGARSGAGAGQGMLNIDLEKQTGFVSRLKGLSEGVSKTTKIISGLTGGIATATDRVRTMDGSFGSMATAMGLTGAAAGVMTKILDTNVDAYRGVQSSAEGSITSFEQMHQAMATSITTATEFSAAMTKGSDGVRLLGGMEWAKFNKGFRDATREVSFYAMTLPQIQAAQSSYLDMLKNQGTLFDLNQNDLVQGLNSLIKINDKMAGILGKNREDQMKAAQDQSRDSDFQTFLQSQNYSQDQLTQINQALAAAKQIDPKLEASIKDMAMSGGGLQGANAAYMGPMSGNQVGQEAISAAQKIFNGQVGPRFAEDMMGSLRDAAKTVPIDQRTTLGQIGRMGGNEDFTAMTRTIMNLLSTKDPAAVPDADKKVGGDAEKAVLGVEEAAKSVAASMDAALNRVMDTTLGKFGTTIKDSNTAIVEWSDSLRRSMGNMNSLTDALALTAGAGGTGLLIASIGTVGAAAGIFATKMATGLVKSGAKLAFDGAKALTNVAAEGAKRTGSIFSSAARSADAVGDAARGAAGAAETAAQAAARAGAGAGSAAGEAAQAGTAAVDAIADAAKDAGKAAQNIKPVEPAWAKAMKADAIRPPEPATIAPKPPVPEIPKPAPATNVPVEPVRPVGAVGEAAGDAAQAAGKGSNALSAAAKAAKFAARFGTPISMLLQGAETYGEITDLNAKHESGEISDDQFKKEFSKSLAKALGGIGGGILGAQLGAAAGAAGGTMVAPGVGTAVGGVGGAIAGGMGGMFAGKEMASALTDSVFALVGPGNAAQAPAAMPQVQGSGGNAPTVTPPSTDTTARTGAPVEVPLTARDIKQPFDNLQTAMVAQLEQSNKLLEAIRDLIRINNEATREGTVSNAASQADMSRALDEMGRTQRNQNIY